MKSRSKENDRKVNNFQRCAIFLKFSKKIRNSINHLRRKKKHKKQTKTKR